jgi:hypothetical protein
MYVFGETNTENSHINEAYTVAIFVVHMLNNIDSPRGRGGGELCHHTLGSVEGNMQTLVGR